MRLPFFPSPYPDELLYSVIARYHFRSGNTGPTTTIKEIFNKKTLPIIELPTMIGKIFEKISEDTEINPEWIINNLTMYPYYRPFLTEERDRKIIHSMVATNHVGVSPRMHLGFSRTYYTRLYHLRYCPKCKEEDKERWGEAYWHRSHQAFGVYICLQHGLPLLSYPEPLDGTKLLSLSNCPGSGARILLNIDSKKNEHYETLAKNIYWLLENPMEIYGLDNLRNNYIYYLSKKGFVLTKNTTLIKFTKLAKEIRTFYHADFLKEMGCYFEPEDKELNTWIGSVLSKKLLVNHPIHHILLAGFLGVSLKELLGDKKSIESPFGKGPWPCLNPAVPHYQEDIITECKMSNRRVRTGLPVGVFKCSCGFVYSRVGPDKNESDKYRSENIISHGSAWEENLIRLAINERIPRSEISRKLKVPVYMIKSCLRRLLNNERENRISERQEKMDLELEHKRSEWLSIVNNNPGMKRTDLRKITKTYYWLNKYDNAWFISHCPRPTQKIIPAIETDWDKRDRDLVKKIFMASRQIKDTKGKPIKITIESVSRELGINNALHRSAINRMPLTQKALKEIVEELPEFYLRKVRWGIKTLLENGASLTISKVLKIAGGKRELIMKIIEEELERISPG